MKTQIIRLIAIVSAILLLTACSEADEPAATALPAQPAMPISTHVIADVEIVPAREMMLVFETSGTINEVLVDEGALIQAGETILQLEENENLTAELAAAEHELEAASQALDILERNTPVDKESAYQMLLDTQAYLLDAEEAYDDFDQDDHDDQLEDIRVDIIDAEEELSDSEEELEDYADFDQDSNKYKDKEDAVEDAEKDLNQLNRDLDRKELELSQLKKDLITAQAQLDLAITDWDKYADGTHEDALSLAEARINAAQEAVDALKAAQAKRIVTAPFAGRIVHLPMEAGDFASAGSIAAVLIDDTAWYAETIDLNELEVVKIQVGETVEVKLDAFPDEEITGTIEEISDFPGSYHNDVTYKTRILLDDTNLNLRWKMTGVATFSDN